MNLNERVANVRECLTWATFHSTSHYKRYFGEIWAQHGYYGPSMEDIASSKSPCMAQCAALHWQMGVPL